MTEKELANILRKRLLDKQLLTTKKLENISDYTVIDSYITCSCCGEKEVSKEKLIEIILQSKDAESFFDLLNANSRLTH